MKKRFCQFAVVALVVSSAACTSVPEVETRLQSLQLHSNMYVVQAGETVESIAYRYQLTPEELVAINPGIRNNIVAGLRINVRPGTTLSQDVRARASYAPAQQPQIVSRGFIDPNTNQQGLSGGNEVVVSPTYNDREIALRQPVETVIPDTMTPIQNGANTQISTAQQQQPVVAGGKVIQEIPATSWSNERVVVNDGRFTEEVIPDDLDYVPVEKSRAAMNDQLQQFVGEWSWPTEGQVAREFAPQEAGGQGVDIAGVPGQDIRAAMAGTVVYSGRDLSGGGNLIIVKHDDSLMTTYSHADQLFVAEDDQVVAGDPLGSLGWNANRESVLRFEVRKDGSPLDPMKFLPLR